MTRMDAKFNQEKIIRANSCDSRADLFSLLFPGGTRCPSARRRSPRRAKAAQRVSRKILRVCSGSRVRQSDGLVPWRAGCNGISSQATRLRARLRRGKHAYPYSDTRMRLRASVDARRDHRSRLQPITDHRSLEIFVLRRFLWALRHGAVATTAGHKNHVGGDADVNFISATRLIEPSLQLFASHFSLMGEAVAWDEASVLEQASA
jgi:hypothetical protein